MSARNCPECGGLVASTINVCPHCGYSMSAGGAKYANATAENPYNSIVWCIISVLLFWPLGVAAIIYYFKSDSCWQVGNQQGAELYGRRSISFAKWSILLFFIWPFTISALLAFL